MSRATDTRTPPRSRASFWAIGFALLVILIEVLSFVFGSFFDKSMFSEEDAYFASVNEDLFERWRTSPWADAELGWDTPKQAMTENRKNCVGQMVTYA